MNAVGLSSLRTLIGCTALVALSGLSGPLAAAPLPIAQEPLYLAVGEAPLNMLVMGKDHKNYYEAYNDASDLDGDGALDVGYKPDTIDYYGYFNSNVCYSWNSSGNRFDPSTVAGGSNDKKCSGAGQWSGDFLNYLTTSRMDALRKVLYGGYRHEDTTSRTVLQGAFFPQDGHSWGKEYQSIARDGYDIREYAPLTLPAANRYHLFAVTTVTDNSAPLLRVLNNSPYRIWNWVSIEGPVAGNKCFTSGNSRVDCEISGAQPHPGHPRSRGEFDTMEVEYAIPDYQFGSMVNRNAIDCNNSNCNPNGSDDNYLTIITGRIRIDIADNYRFRIDGDDNIDFAMYNSSGNLVASAGCYPNGRGFGACGGNEIATANSLAAGTYTFKFRHEEASGGDGYLLEWERRSQPNGNGNTDNARFPFRTMYVKGEHSGSGNGADANASGGFVSSPEFRFYTLTPSSENSSITNYTVRVQACPATAALRESNCKVYPNGTSVKPTGILHDFGETERMYFGLLTGSQRNNLEGGVLRRNIQSFADEIIANTGQFDTSVTGIARTLDALRMIGGGYSGGTTNNLNSDSNWNWDNGTGGCPSIGDRPISNGECRMWGNPIGEMMLEALRYYAGGSAHSGYTAGGSSAGGTEETTMGLPSPTWRDPYKPVSDGGQGFKSCAKPVMTVISDINPSYDGNVPGGAWGGTGIPMPSTLSDFSLSDVGSSMWNNEFGAGGRTVFIGQVGTTATDGAPTAKSASSFGNIRGLAPEEPSKGGSFSSAAVAYYGWTKEGRINTRSSEKVRTYAVALASPLPRIQFPVDGRTVTFVPFAKTAGGTFGGGAQKPTNTIVDFYIEEYVNLPGQDVDNSINDGRPYAVFRINYEDVEQGNDHDMDAIVRYEFRAEVDGTVTVTLNSEYAAGSAIQHMGYIAEGTTADGVYLEVRDSDTAQSNSPAYIFNTPPGRAAGYCNTSPMPGDCGGLPLNATRSFTPSTGGGSVTVLRDPLWYAAKYGGFTDLNNNGRPDLPHEWDEDGDGTPDKYFLVTNALTLKEQLAEAFSEIEDDARPTGGVAASGARRDEGFLAYVPEYNAVGWSGELRAYFLQSNGRLGDQAWQATERLPSPAERNVFAVVNGTMVEFTAGNLGGNAAAQAAALGLGASELANDYDDLGIDAVVDYVLGVDTYEQKNGGPFRDRVSPLADMLNSQPEVLTKGSYSYTSLPEALGGGFEGAGSYGEFLESKQSRVPVVLVGSNGGMLHGFDARADANGGKELFAVIPGSSLPGMSELLSPGYTHRYYVDGSPLQHDANINGNWKTVMVTTMAAGGRSVLALDVTDPVNDFDEDNFLWEFAHEELGYTLGQVRIGLLEDDTWVAIFGNGYNSDSETASLFVVDLATGTLLQRIPVTSAESGHNGLAGPALADLDNNGRVDTAYAGDLHGNVWKFDLSGAPGSWGSAFGATTPLFVARSPSGERQEITGAPAVSRHHSLGRMVFIGTGRYFLDGDNAVLDDPPVDSFYALWDNNDNSDPINSRAELTRQFIEQEVQTSAGTARVTSENLVDWSAKRGWFMDLQVDDGTTASPAGERFLGRPRVALGRVIFTTFTPTGDECQPGGDNWLYSLSATDGASMLNIPEGGIDPDGDGPLGPEPGCADCGGLQVGEGAPAVVPPIVTTPPDAPSPVCLPSDPDCVPPVPCDPESDPSCVPDAHAGKIKIGVLLADGLSNFIYISPGRQSWRQVD